MIHLRYHKYFLRIFLVSEPRDILHFFLDSERFFFLSYRQERAGKEAKKALVCQLPDFLI